MVLLFAENRKFAIPHSRTRIRLFAENRKFVIFTKITWHHFEAVLSMESCYWVSSIENCWRFALPYFSLCQVMVAVQSLSYSNLANNLKYDIKSQVPHEKPQPSWAANEGEENLQTLADCYAVNQLFTQLYYICFTLVLDGGRWVIVGWCNGSRYKKWVKTTVQMQAATFMFNNPVCLFGANYSDLIEFGRDNTVITLLFWKWTSDSRVRHLPQKCVCNATVPIVECFH